MDVFILPLLFLKMSGEEFGKRFFLTSVYGVYLITIRVIKSENSLHCCFKSGADKKLYVSGE